MKYFVFLFLISFDLNAEPAKLSEVLPLFQSKCAVCHKGPYLDFTKYPFYSDIFTTPQALMNEVKQRILGQKKKMPPVNAPTLTDLELERIVSWIDGNMPEDEIDAMNYW